MASSGSGSTMSPKRRRSASLEYGVVENCAPNEPFSLNGFDFVFDACAIRGERMYMEDRWCAVLDEDKEALVLAVYDGHGGASVSSHLSRNLAREVLRETSLREDPAGAFKRAFKRVDDVVCAENPGEMRGTFGRPGAGSTAIMALIMPPKMYIANVGDSRATTFDSHGWERFVSADQRPSVSEEKERIVRDGGFVKRGRDGLLRTGGILAVSRAFGNAGIKQFVSVEPEVSVVDLDTVDSLILCSDGLTDVMGSKLASETMRAVPQGTMPSSPSPVRTRRVANSLVTLARVRQSKDNISVVVLQVRRSNAALPFTSLETPVSNSMSRSKSQTPMTVPYNPVMPSSIGSDDEHVIGVSLEVHSGEVRLEVRVDAPNELIDEEMFDGLSSPARSSIERDSTQAITPIVSPSAVH